MKRTLYLAYGSNMNIQQMAQRCPTATVVGTARLAGYRLLFRGPDGGAVATVARFKGGAVPVLLWDITPADEAALDRYEGWPRLYRKETVKVKLDGEKVEAMVYIMNPGRSLGRPSRYYFDVIREGYAAANLDTAPLYKAVRDSIDCVAFRSKQRYHVINPKGNTKITEDAKMRMGLDNWTQGKINGYAYSVKHYETGSEYGIGGNGKISKLSIRKDGKELYNYDRGLDFDQLDAEGRAVYAELLARYN